MGKALPLCKSEDLSGSPEPDEGKPGHMACVPAVTALKGGWEMESRGYLDATGLQHAQQ